MNKAELAAALARQIGSTKADTEMMVNATFKKMMSIRTARFERADRTAAGHQVTVTYRTELCL